MTKQAVKIFTTKKDECITKLKNLEEEKTKLQREMVSPSQHKENANKISEAKREADILDSALEFAETGNYQSVDQIIDIIHKDLLDMKMQAVENDSSTVDLNKDIKCLKEIKSQLNSKPVVDTNNEVSDIPSIDFDDF